MYPYLRILYFLTTTSLCQASPGFALCQNLTISLSPDLAHGHLVSTPQDLAITNAKQSKLSRLPRISGVSFLGLNGRGVRFDAECGGLVRAKKNVGSWSRQQETWRVVSWRRIHSTEDTTLH
jgi:hypothetical protein